VRHSPRKSPKVRQKEKKDKAKQLEKIVDLEAEELCNGMEELDAEEGKPITKLLEYIPLQKGKMKVTKYMDLGKFMVSTQLLLK